MSTVPLTVTPEAEALIAELGMWEDMLRMVEWMRQNAPLLRFIEVVRKPSYGGTEERPLLIIEAHCDEPPANKPIDGSHPLLGWGEWKARNFSLQTCLHFIMMPWFHPVRTDAA